MPENDNKFRVLFKFALNGMIVSQDIDIGLIQDISNTYTISKTTSGMPTQPAQNAFAMDLGVTRTYRFEFIRINPPEPDDRLGEIVNGEYVPSDPKQWSNGFWIYIMKRFLVNRWQMETDGCKIYYLVDESKKEFYPQLNVTNAYISEFKPSQKPGPTNVLSGPIAFTIGATNIVKEVSNYTIIFDANYKSFSTLPEAQNDDTNMVRVSEKNQLPVPIIPADWNSRAVSEELGIVPHNAGWCKSPDGTGTIYHPTDTEGIPLDSEETTLYVIWVVN